MNLSAITVLVGIFALLAVLWVLHRVTQWGKHGGWMETVYEWEYGLLYVNGKFGRILPAGRHFKWPPTSRHDVFKLRRTGLAEYTQPVDATSKDGLVFRISAVVSYQIVDPRQAHEEIHVEKLRIAINNALVQLAAAHNLQQLLTDRTVADAALKSLFDARISGCEITAAAIQSIVLPPEVRRLFTEIERAKLEGIAALERARGENAALRSLANAAGMLKGNPELMNLRLLQTAAAGKNQLTVVLGKDGLAAADATGRG